MGNIAFIYSGLNKPDSVIRSANESLNVGWVGIGSPGAAQWSWPAKGLIDDVRIYNRAIGAAEVKALFEGK